MSRPEGQWKIEAEGGGWLTLRQPEPALAGKPAADLLTRTAALPGNLRYALRPGAGIEMLGELRGGADGLPVESARDRFVRLLTREPGEATESTPECLEALLESSGLGWSRRNTAWAVPVTEAVPRELYVERTAGGARVQAVLVEWDEIGAAETQALARFLTAAQGGLRFARCELDARSARVVSQVDTAHLETDLVHSLLGVAAGCRLLVREVRALLEPEVARHYLAFHGESGAV